MTDLGWRPAESVPSQSSLAEGTGTLVAGRRHPCPFLIGFHRIVGRLC